jgi:hypothetical protein
MSARCLSSLAMALLFSGLQLFVIVTFLKPLLTLTPMAPLIMATVTPLTITLMITTMAHLWRESIILLPSFPLVNSLSLRKFLVLPLLLTTLSWIEHRLSLLLLSLPLSLPPFRPCSFVHRISQCSLLLLHIRQSTINTQWQDLRRAELNLKGTSVVVEELFCTYHALDKGIHPYNSVDNPTPRPLCDTRSDCYHVCRGKRGGGGLSRS